MADKPTASKVKSALNKEKVHNLYLRLEGQWHGLESDSQTVGPLALYLKTIEELEVVIDYDFSPFKPDIKLNKDLKQICDLKELKAQMSALLSELRQEYAPELLAHFKKELEGNVLINQTQTSTQEFNFTQTVIYDLDSKLDNALKTYKKKSPERSFIDILRQNTKNVKDVASLVGLIIGTAQAVNLDIGQLRILLGSIGIAP